ncbi:MAG: hypothetical protein AAGJ91_03665 [Pseudomonadota bacterium]
MSDMNNDNQRVTIARGRASDLGKAKSEETSWGDCREDVLDPLKTKETFAEYKALPDLKQKALKKGNGWWMGTGIDKDKRNRKSVQCRRVITLDGDYFTPGALELLEEGLMFRGVEQFFHTTRSHTPENPKVRVAILANRPIRPDEYSLVCRLVCDRENIELFDMVSARPAQLMYLGSYSRDMERHYRQGFRHGSMLDVDELLAWGSEKYGDLDDRKNWPTFPGEPTPREAADEAEDPLEKDGLIGAFCRAWSFTEAISEGGPLEGLYEPTQWNQGVVTRASYLHGTSADGAIFYDDKFMFSHHGSDPCQEQLVNVFDATRIHNFVDKDSQEDLEGPIGQRPSFKAMSEFAKKDDRTSEIRRSERYDFDGMLDELSEPGDQPPAEQEESDAYDKDYISQPKKAEKPEEKSDDPVKPSVRIDLPEPSVNWNNSLSYGGLNGLTLKNNAHNVAIILQSDPRLRNKMAFNEFSQEIVQTGPIISGVRHIENMPCAEPFNGVRWEDAHDDFLTTLMSGPSKANGGLGYDLSPSVGALRAGLITAAKRRPFHPLKEMLYEAHIACMST